MDAGLDCSFDSNRARRGPKKGHIKDLRSRIGSPPPLTYPLPWEQNNTLITLTAAALERVYGQVESVSGLAALDMTADDHEHQHNRNNSDADTIISRDTSHENELDLDLSRMDTSSNSIAEQEDLSSMLATFSPQLDSMQMDGMMLPDDASCLGVSGLAFDLTPLPEDRDRRLTRFKPVRTPDKLGATNVLMADLVRAELDQLFFDRAHFFLPILDPAHYFSWARPQWFPSESHVGLQYAVWTMAASRSSQFHGMRDSLYHDTRKILATLALDDDDTDEAPFLLQRAQALLIVGIYEFTHNLFTRAWATTGQAIRLVQILKLDKLDVDIRSPLDPLSGGDHLVSPGPKHMPGSSDTDSDTDAWMLAEKRTTFWVAFCVDRLFCGIEGMPMAMAENQVRVLHIIFFIIVLLIPACKCVKPVVDHRGHR